MAESAVDPAEVGKDLDPKVPVEATSEEIKEIEQAEASPDKKTLYIHRVGYGNMVFHEGSDKKGTPVYFIDVKKKVVGWDITVRRGGDKHGEAILHLKKAHSSDVGDSSSKASTVDESVSASTESEDPDEGLDELNPAHAHEDSTVSLNKDEADELSKQVQDLKLSDEKVAPLCVLQRKHAFRSNRNVFEFNGHTYAWDYKIFIGALHTLKNLDTNEVIAICKLKAGVSTQSITAWGLR